MAKRQTLQPTNYTPYRVYTESELKDFDKKIQRFYVTKKILNKESRDFMKEVKVLDYDELAVAYGAMVKVAGPNGTSYCLEAKHDGPGHSRFEQFNNLMRQYDWRKSQKDWKQEMAIQNSLSFHQAEAESVVTDKDF